MNEQARDKIEKLLDAQEFDIRNAFARYMKSVRDPKVLDRVAELLEAGKVDRALEVLAAEDHHIREEIFAIIIAAAALEIGLWRTFTGRAIALNPAGMATVSLYIANAEAVSRDLTLANRGIIADLARRARTGQVSRDEIARTLRAQIGLTERDIKAINNYRRLLERGSSQALDRVLRDKTMDAAVRAAADTPLTPGQIDRMVAAYTKNTHRRRQLNFARTLSTRVTSEGRRLAFQQVLTQLGQPIGAATHEWRSQRDFRVRDTHRPHVGLDGQVRPLNQPFVSPSGARLRYPGDPAAPAGEVMNCRCYEIFGLIGESTALV